MTFKIEQMITINQLRRNKRKKKKVRNKIPALQKRPQKKGVCTKIFFDLFLQK